MILKEYDYLDYLIVGWQNHIKDHPSPESKIVVFRLKRNVYNYYVQNNVRVEVIPSSDLILVLIVSFMESFDPLR